MTRYTRSRISARDRIAKAAPRNHVDRDVLQGFVRARCPQTPRGVNSARHKARGLILDFQAPTPLGSQAALAWAPAHAAALEVVTLPAAGHHAPEDAPREIGETIASWLAKRQRLA